MLRVRLVRFLASHLLPKRDREFILGDLEELYHEARTRGERGAANRYVWNALTSIVTGRRRVRRRDPQPVHSAFSRPSRELRGSPRAARGGSTLSDFEAALSSTFRSLKRQPTLGLMIILTLGLGVGAPAAVFGLVNQLLLSPLPGVRDPDGAAYLTFVDAENPRIPERISSPDFQSLRASATLLDGIAAYTESSTRNVTVGSGRPAEVTASVIHGDFFEVLGVRAVRGRLLSADETGPDADPLVAVISERLWRSLLGGTEDVVGRSIEVNGRPVTIVGVAGDGFAGAVRHRTVDMWLPWSSYIPLNGFTRQMLLSRNSTMYGDVVVRPRAGVRLETAEAQLGELISGLADANAESADNLRSIQPVLSAGLHTVPADRAQTYRALAILFGSGALILLIACANVANLLLFRGLGRQADWAVRRALGASAARVARQELIESLVLAALGVAAGLLVGWCVALLFRGEQIIFRSEEFAGLTFDLRVLGFAAAAIVVTTLLFGVLPAILSGRVDLSQATRGAGRRETGRGVSLLGALSALQIGLCLPLLVGALLLTRTVRNLYDVETGLTADGVAALMIDLNTLGYDATQLEALHRRLLSAVTASPSVASAALDVYGPFSASMRGVARLPSDAEEERIGVSAVFVTPDWFSVLGVAPIRGRVFRDDD